MRLGRSGTAIQVKLEIFKGLKVVLVFERVDKKKFCQNIVTLIELHA